MTLHWWMHWFWVTVFTIIVCSMSHAAPQSEELQHITTDPQTQYVLSERHGRAMYFTKTQYVSTTTRPAPVKPTDGYKQEINKSIDIKLPEDLAENVTATKANNSEAANVTEIVHPSIQWTPVNSTNEILSTNQTQPINASSSFNSSLTNSDNGTVSTTKRRNNLTRHPDIKELDTSIEGASESRIVTEKPLSLETTYLQTRIPANVESSRRIIDQSLEDGGMDTGAIAGISFAALVLAALAGSTAFVLYRRRYLNKPQTLNDKCSNPDSSGYLDDSTIRDNSEEMYSLDNDSFLNSLEAMTIQNYWTDTVKHTKL